MESGGHIQRQQWQRIRSLFDRVLELETAERALFLDVACADDGGLRSAVDALLAADAVDESQPVDALVSDLFDAMYDSNDQSPANAHAPSARTDGILPTVRRRPHQLADQAAMQAMIALAVALEKTGRFTDALDVVERFPHAPIDDQTLGDAESAIAARLVIARLLLRLDRRLESAALLTDIMNDEAAQPAQQAEASVLAAQCAWADARVESARQLVGSLTPEDVRLNRSNPYTRELLATLLHQLR